MRAIIDGSLIVELQDLFLILNPAETSTNTADIKPFKELPISLAFSFKRKSKTLLIKDDNVNNNNGDEFDKFITTR